MVHKYFHFHAVALQSPFPKRCAGSTSHMSLGSVPFPRHHGSAKTELLLAPAPQELKSHLQLPFSQDLYSRSLADRLAVTEPDVVTTRRVQQLSNDFQLPYSLLSALKGRRYGAVSRFQALAASDGGKGGNTDADYCCSG